MPVIYILGIVIVAVIVIAKATKEKAMKDNVKESFDATPYMYSYYAKKIKQDQSVNNAIHNYELRKAREPFLVNVAKPENKKNETAFEKQRAEKIAKDWISNIGNKLEEKYSSATEDYIVFTSGELPFNKKSWKFIAKELNESESLGGYKIESNSIKFNL